MSNNPDVCRVELITFPGNEVIGLGPRKILVGHHGPDWVGLPIRAWFWNGDLDSWDEIRNVSTLLKIVDELERR